MSASDIAARLGVPPNLVDAIARQRGMLGRVFTVEQAERVEDIIEPPPRGVA